MSGDFFVYVLTCPTTGNIRYVGVTRNPQNRKIAHRSRKSHATLDVDVWTDRMARNGTPVGFEVVATCTDIAGVGSLAIQVEESIISYCRKAGYSLLNADVPAIKRRKKSRASAGAFALRLGE